MKFALVLFAALAVVSASAPESESGDNNLIEKLSKWFHFQIPLFAPIRTTTPRRPAARTTRPTPRTTRATRPTTRRTTTAPPTTTQAPAEPEPEQPEQQPEENGPVSAEVMNALNNLYNIESLRDQLPPMSDILNVDPAQQEMFNRPIGEIADEFTLNLIQSVLNYMQSRPEGSINLDDPIDLTADGSSV